MSSPLAEILGAEPAAAFIIVISLTALATLEDGNFINSLFPESKMLLAVELNLKTLHFGLLAASEIKTCPADPASVNPVVSVFA